MNKEIRRTVVVETSKIPKETFNIFVELEGMYSNMVEQLTPYGVSNSIKSFTRLKALKYYEIKNMYPHLPSHYAYTVCQDAATRSKSFLRLKKLGKAEKEYPVVEKVSIWLDDHLWKPSGLTSIMINTHKGWVRVELEPHRQYWEYVNSGWRPASEARIKLDKKNRKLEVYLTFIKEPPQEYQPKDFIPVDLNENNVTLLVESKPLLFETNTSKIVLGYHYRRKRIQEKYGAKSRVKKKIMEKLKEKDRKNDIKWKIANLVVRLACDKQYGIVLEKLDKNVGKKMISKIGDEQLRHRISQVGFNGVQNAILLKAGEHGVPVVFVDPKNTSRTCPIHSSIINYDNNSRVGKCTGSGELWHRDVTACWNLLFKAYLGDGSSAPSPSRPKLDGSPVPLGSTATHEPTRISKSLWTRWKSLLLIQKEIVLNKMK